MSKFLPSMPLPSAQSVRMQSIYSTHVSMHVYIGAGNREGGFTLLEVLVALVIIGTAFAASLRAISSLTQNSSDLRASMMATWSAENRLSQIRLPAVLIAHRLNCRCGVKKRFTQHRILHFVGSK